MQFIYTTAIPQMDCCCKFKFYANLNCFRIQIIRSTFYHSQKVEKWICDYKRKRLYCTVVSETTISIGKLIVIVKMRSKLKYKNKKTLVFKGMYIPSSLASLLFLSWTSLKTGRSLQCPLIQNQESCSWRNCTDINREELLINQAFHS